MGSMSASTQEPSLERRISLPLLTFYGLGTILGAGIYALVGKVAGRAGMLAPWSFLLASALASFTAIAYAELSSRFPRSAGEAVYVDQAFARRWLTLGVGLLVVVTGVVSSAAMARSFAGYWGVFVDAPDWLVMVALMTAISLLAAWGIKESLTAAMIITLIEVAGLLLIVWVARGGLAELPQRWGELTPGWDAGAWMGLWLGTFLAFYAFIGFEDMVNVVEEVKAPAKTVPPAIMIALVVATFLYGLVALAAVLALPVEQLAVSEAPLADIYKASTGSEPRVIALIGLFAVTNGALVQIIMGSRILYGLSRAGWLPPAFGRVNHRTRTPLLATAVVTVSVLLLALWFPLEGLAEATTFIILIVFALVNISLWRVKRRDPTPAGIRTYPLWIPVVGAVVCLGSIIFRMLSLVGIVHGAGRSLP